MCEHEFRNALLRLERAVQCRLTDRGSGRRLRRLLAVDVEGAGHQVSEAVQGSRRAVREVAGLPESGCEFERSAAAEEVTPDGGVAGDFGPQVRGF